MLILSMKYDHYKDDGSHIGDFSLVPSNGEVDFPESSETDVPKIVHIFLQQAFGSNIAEKVYTGENKSITTFTVKVKINNYPKIFKFVATPENYKELFHIQG